MMGVSRPGPDLGIGERSGCLALRALRSALLMGQALVDAWA